jgi:hypothetical protein
MSRQEELLELLKTENKKMLLYMSKEDIAPEEKQMAVKQMHPDIITTIEELKARLADEIRRAK